MTYNVGFYCKSIPFGPDQINLRSSLGGSESAMVMMAHELVRLGHSVSIFTTIPDPTHEGSYPIDPEDPGGPAIHWYNETKFPDVSQGVEWDVFISLRFYHILNAPFKAKMRILWNEDVWQYKEIRQLFSALWQTDRMYYVSQFQRAYFEERLPNELQEVGWVTSNGVDLSRVDMALHALLDDQPEDDSQLRELITAKKKPQLIYISRPERGLRPLLQLWPKLRELRPSLELKVCRYYSMYETNPNVAAICQWADEAVANTEGVSYLGNLPKDQLYSEIASSLLMIYPGVPDFAETNCIAALEAQACYTPLIAGYKGAIPETLGYPDTADGTYGGLLVKGNAMTEEVQAEYVQTVLDLLDDPDRYTELQDMGRSRVERLYTYRFLAETWVEDWDRFFQRRFKESPGAVMRNLIHHDDYVAASMVADMFPDSATIQGYYTKEWDAAKATEDPDYYHKHAMESRREYEGSSRAREVVKTMGLCFAPGDEPPKRMLDFAGGNGAIAAHMAEAYPDAELVYLDWSDKLVDQATEFHKSRAIQNIKPIVGSFEEAQAEAPYDLIFCGEFLEHTENPEETIEMFTSWLTEDGWIIWTVPYGPLLEFFMDNAGMRTHRVHWEFNNVIEVFDEKDGMAAEFLPGNTTPRGNGTGTWMIRHKKGGRLGEINWEKKIKLTRPYQRLSVCMIAKNDEDWISGCIKSVRPVLDDLYIGLNGSVDATRAICEAAGATIIELPEMAPDAPPEAPAPGDFSWMRNKSIEQALGDWLFWIDCDERLADPQNLRKYLDTSLFDGLILRQQHMMIDAPSRHDRPVRIFRRSKGFEFVGYIHEHAMMGENEPIEPSYEPWDTEILHHGYVTEGQRRSKCQFRNMQLLAIDRQRNPNRKIGAVLEAREYLNMANWDVVDMGLKPTEIGALPGNAIRTRQLVTQAVRIWDEGDFATFKHPNIKIMWPLYQRALNLLGIGFQLPLNIGGDESEPQLFRFRNWDEVQKFIAWRIEEIRHQEGAHIDWKVTTDPIVGA